ncbi:hypothetical protein DFA_05517 [Cavenderia fasciculata]|uniref:GB1/RHD3-type G domain-containing protein n=1 Tax=Cavenderia fasciculata TaxID=261658 RepID=F4PLG3_CACFS|nr:uncharacterized protein DFA_05517 [Cavenderia fasciculata]EGG23385.1 hypothetical protein DFA_05517 [Cavenderia fasciculata]|eukprot:XP_004361236.1 hypothetical protein DFA_05517 [Cavenderia fasciculata]
MKVKVGSIPLIHSNRYRYEKIKDSLVLNENVRPDEPLQFVVNQDALKILQSIDKPLAVISINGMSRTGKSLVAGRFFGRQSQVFPVSNQSEACTHGIWMSTEVIDRGSHAVLLLDAEGMNHVSSSHNSDNAIFLLSMLLSSTFIYNSKNLTTASDIDQISVVCKLNQSFKIKVNETINSPSEMTDHLPNFCWLIRDFYLNPTVDGRSVTLGQYIINNVLTFTDKFEPTPEEKKKNDLSRMILRTFKSFKPYSLPHIDHNGFDQELDMFITEMLNTSKPKNGFKDGTTINGPILSQMVVEYTKAINQPGVVPSIESTWNNIVSTQKIEACRVSTQAYLDGMTNATNTDIPIEYDQLFKLHETFLSKSLQLFVSKIDNMITDEIEINSLISNFKNEISLNKEMNGEIEIDGGLLYQFIQKNMEKSKKYNQSIIGPMSIDLTNNYFKRADEIEFKDLMDRFQRIETIYKEKSKGPARNQVWKLFLQDFYNQEQQFKTMKNYNQELKEVKKNIQERQVKQKEMDDRTIELQENIKNKQEESQKILKATAKAQAAALAKMSDQIKQQAIEGHQKLKQLEESRNRHDAEMVRQHQEALGRAMSEINSLQSMVSAKIQNEAIQQQQQQQHYNPNPHPSFGNGLGGGQCGGGQLGGYQGGFGGDQGGYQGGSGGGLGGDQGGYQGGFGGGLGGQGGYQGGGYGTTMTTNSCFSGQGNTIGGQMTFDKGETLSACVSPNALDLNFQVPGKFSFQLNNKK